jgi:hypothetical protein
VSDERTHRIEGKSADELLASLMDAEPRSPAHEQIKAAIGVRIAELQRDAARDSLKWARLAALSTALAAAIALVAFLATIL